MKASKMMAMTLSVVVASQMMVPMAFGAETSEAMETLYLAEATEDIAGEGYAFAYAEEGSTLTITGDVVVAGEQGIVLPTNATLVVEEDASLTVYAEATGIYADGDMDLVIDGDLTVVVEKEDVTEEDYLYGVVASGTYDADGVYTGDAQLTIAATGSIEIVGRDGGVYGSGGVYITGGTWNIDSITAIASNTNEVTLENCELYTTGIYAVYAGSVMTIGDGCVIFSEGAFVGGDISVSETGDINAMIGYDTYNNDMSEYPWTMMVVGDVVYTIASDETGCYNDHLIFADGATLTITEGAIFDLSASEEEGDMGGTMDTTGGTIVNNGTLVFKEGTTEEEIAAMNIAGDGVIAVAGVVEEEEEVVEEVVEEVSSEVSFADVSESNWFYDAVYFVAEAGLMEGISETEFAPKEVATYAVFVEAMSTFSDDVAAPENADEALTREAMVSILYACMGEPEVEGDLSQFTDGATISEDAKDAMVWAVSEGLIAGNPDGTLDPTAGATRAQVATILLRLVQNMTA